MSTALADTAVTPALLLEQVRAARVAADAAEARILGVAVEWAQAHPVLDGGQGWRITAASAQPMEQLDGTALALEFADLETGELAEERLGWCGIPPVAWDAPAAFAAANRMSTAAGKALIRDALVLCHRLPRIWALVGAGQVPAWRARRIAQAVLGSPADVVAYLDDQIAPVAATVGPTTLDRTIAEAMLRMHAEIVELEQAVAEHGHHATFHTDPRPDGSAELHARGDWKDLHALAATVARIAAALKTNHDEPDETDETDETGESDPLDARRARALGVLADPARALALLNQHPAPAPAPAESSATVASRTPVTPVMQAVVYLHLTDLALLGLDPVALNDTPGTRPHPLLVQQVHQWLSRTDTHVVIKPLVDLTTELHTESYTIPDRLREQTQLINPTCVFPWCTTPARRCDLDHLDPWSAQPGGGTTSSSNLAPLCRHHHRLKTHTTWTYRRLEPRVFLWTDPTGHHYLRNKGSTTVVDRPPPPPPAS